jgi:Tol biopolymer transport system component
VVKSGFIVVVTLVMVASAAGSPGRTNGDLLLLRGQHLFVVTSAGTDVRELTPQGFNVESAAWSRSGRRVAMGANKHIWVMNADGTGLRQVTSGNLSEGAPSWSPDGRWIAFSSARTGYDQVWVLPTTGGRIRRVSHRRTSCASPAWSPDGKWIAYSCVLGFPKLVVARVGGRTDRVVTRAANVTAEDHPAWTPNSRTLLFTRSNGVHLDGVYSVSSSGRSLRRLVPAGREPTVSPDGSRLAFVRDNHLWIAARNGAGARPVTSGPVAEAEPDWGPR